MRIYRTVQGLVVEEGNDLFLSETASFDALVTRGDVEAYLKAKVRTWPRVVQERSARSSLEH